MRYCASALSAVLLLCAAGNAQSLADAARQNRQQKAQNTDKATKVFTSDDLSPSPESELTEQGMLDPKQTPEEWTHNILEEKTKIHFLESQLVILTSQQTQLAQNDVPNAPNIKQWQDDVARRLERAKTGLATEKMKLELLQAAAQKAGMPSSVYDPGAKPRMIRSNAGVLRDMYSPH